MTAAQETAREDLAFLRTLLDHGDGAMTGFGEAYLAAGLIYGAQMLGHAAQMIGWLPAAGAATWLIGVGPTAVFVPLIFWINWRHRKDRPPAAVGRAITAVFGAVGMANLALVAVIGSVALREHSLTTWLIYPCAVFILQGAAWCVAALMRRRLWMGGVALGWGVAAIAMAASVNALAPYILFAAAGIWLCMALPGWLILRQTRRAPMAAAVA